MVGQRAGRQHGHDRGHSADVDQRAGSVVAAIRRCILRMRAGFLAAVQGQQGESDGGDEFASRIMVSILTGPLGPMLRGPAALCGCRLWNLHYLAGVRICNEGML